jgi:hypothetical protein
VWEKQALEEIKVGRGRGEIEVYSKPPPPMLFYHALLGEAMS